MVWLPSRNGSYSLRSAWEVIRVSNGRQDWCSSVWFPKNVPRWAFILWMAMQGKLASKDRLLKWSVVDNATCVLCRNGLLNLIIIYFLIALSLELSGRRYCEGTTFIEAHLCGKMKRNGSCCILRGRQSGNVFSNYHWLLLFMEFGVSGIRGSFSKR